MLEFININVDPPQCPIYTPPCKIVVVFDNDHSKDIVILPCPLKQPLMHVAIAQERRPPTSKAFNLTPLEFVIFHGSGHICQTTIMGACPIYQGCPKGGSCNEC